MVSAVGRRHAGTKEVEGCGFALASFSVVA
jgi:hypothetical protein